MSRTTIAASTLPTAFLGMIVGESISRKVDPAERRLNFKVPETEDPSAESWRTLIDIDDKITEIKYLQDGIIQEPRDAPAKEKDQMVSAEEFLVDDVDDLDEDLQTYVAPESDAEDSDDDPTLVSREKTPSPLYLRFG